MKWLDEAVADGTTSTGGHPSRTAVFEAVREDRTGPVARRLLQLTGAEPASVRREALDLLRSLVHGADAWEAAAQAAHARLSDEDEGVRRRAADVLVWSGRADLALVALRELADPVVRTALAGRGLPEAAEQLRGDSLAAVRFLAHLSLLGDARSAQWPALDAALLADAEEAAPYVPWLGERWAGALYRLDREAQTYALARHLLGRGRPIALRQVGVQLARRACQDWRAAPVELLPHLVPHIALPGGDDAVRTALISQAAVREHAALIAGAEITPPPRRRRWTRGTSRSYDSRAAAEHLAARPIGIARLSRAREIFGPLLDAGPLTFRQAAQLYNLTFSWPNAMQASCAPLWFRHAGASSLPRLLGLLVRRLDDQAHGEAFMEGLAELGRHALPAVPDLDRIIDRRKRIPVNEPSRDAEMAADELLLAAAVRARGRILEDAASAD
ncbi:hypothetical protein ACWGI8_09715 [Streptomyces sp. NPDC054841]